MYLSFKRSKTATKCLISCPSQKTYKAITFTTALSILSPYTLEPIIHISFHNIIRFYSPFWKKKKWNKKKPGSGFGFSKATFFFMFYKRKRRLCSSASLQLGPYFPVTLARRRRRLLASKQGGSRHRSSRLAPAALFARRKVGVLFFRRSPLPILIGPLLVSVCSNSSINDNNKDDKRKQGSDFAN